MPRKPPAGPRDINEAFLQLSEDLNRQAVTPNIYGYKPHFKQVNFHTVGYLTPDKKWQPCSPADIVTGVADLALLGDFVPLKNKEDLIKIRLYIGGNRSGKTV